MLAMNYRRPYRVRAERKPDPHTEHPNDAIVRVSRACGTDTLGRASPAEYDGLLIPGGFINPDLLRQSAAARDFVREFARHP